MTDQISFLVFASEGSVFTEAAARGMVGQTTTMNGDRVKIIAAELEDTGAIRLTVEGASAEVLELVREGDVHGVSIRADGEPRRYDAAETRAVLAYLADRGPLGMAWKDLPEQERDVWRGKVRDT